jgi:hypothetical protein
MGKAAGCGCHNHRPVSLIIEFHPVSLEAVGTMVVNTAGHVITSRGHPLARGLRVMYLYVSGRICRCDPSRQDRAVVFRAAETGEPQTTNASPLPHDRRYRARNEQPGYRRSHQDGDDVKPGPECTVHPCKAAGGMTRTRKPSMPVTALRNRPTDRIPG